MQPRPAPTQSVVQGAWYELAFTRPGPARERESPVENLLVGLIDRAQRTVDVAIHDLDLSSVANALARAADRGVRVRVVAETNILTNTREREVQTALERLRAAQIPIVGDRPQQTMHHKFTVVDGEWVQTGSWNYTFSETFRNDNHAIVVHSRELAANFTAEFEKMFANRQFGGAKARGAPYQFLSLAGAAAENYFSPQDRPASHVIRWIGTARERIRFLAFSFTHDGIGDAMLERARAGVDVGGVFESSGTRDRFSEYARLKTAGLAVHLDGNPWNMHHKMIVVDGRVSIFGSFNFSASADRDNDENLLIVEDPGLAAAFEAEYGRVLAEALRAG